MQTYRPYHDAADIVCRHKDHGNDFPAVLFLSLKTDHPNKEAANHVSHTDQ